MCGTEMNTHIKHPKECSFDWNVKSAIGQFPVVVNLLEKVMPLATRYTMKQTYAAVNMHTTDVKITPLPSEEKKSTKRYPLITITKAATSHDIIYTEMC